MVLVYEYLDQSQNYVKVVNQQLSHKIEIYCFDVNYHYQGEKKFILMINFIRLHISKKL